MVTARAKFNQEINRPVAAGILCVYLGRNDRIAIPMAQCGKLIVWLNQYNPLDEQDRAHRDQILDFIDKNPDCCERTLEKGHLTASAWLVDSSGKKVLLTHHRKLGRWLQLGGHADGDPNLLSVAIKEVQEESGLRDIQPLINGIFDVDIHQIPETENEKAHFHYDVRFLFQTTSNEVYSISHESTDLAWVDLDHLEELTLESSMLRMKKKWLLLRPKI